MKMLARRLRDTNTAQLVGQFTDIVFDVAAGGGQLTAHYPRSTKDTWLRTAGVNVTLKQKSV